MSDVEKHRWVQADLRVWVNFVGYITATTSGLRPGPGERPESYEEAQADREVFEAIASRKAGTYETAGYMGGATALLGSFGALKLVEDASERQIVLDRFKRKYGEWEDEVLLCAVRNDRAPAIHNCAEPAGGMAETFDLRLEQALEIVEIGLFNWRGWCGFRAEYLDDQQNAALLEEQRRCWALIDRNRVMNTHLLKLSEWVIGPDNLDGNTGIISAGPAGDFALTTFATLDLDPEGGYLLQDLECHFNGTSWRALKRKVVAIANRPGRSPIMFQFGPDGLLDRCGVHMALEGENLDLAISHLCRGVLGNRGLNWLKD